MTFTSGIRHKKATYARKSIAKNKKAASLWLEWILLFAFVIALSALSYAFIVPLVKDTTTSVKKVVFNTDECRQVAISIESVCQDNAAQHLNMTIRNRNYIRIDKIRFNWFGTDNAQISSLSETTKLAPNRIKRYEIDTTTGATIGFVKITPIIYKDNLEVICSEKDTSATDIPVC